MFGKMKSMSLKAFIALFHHWSGATNFLSFYIQKNKAISGQVIALQLNHKNVQTEP